MGSMLTRLAPLTTTGVGSLPFTHPGEAARHAIGAYALPFCPQLPRAYGDMVQEWLGADPERCGWAPDRDRQLPAAWDDFILELAARPPSHGVVKLQVTGPLTLAMALSHRSGDLEGFAREIAGCLAAAVNEQVRCLVEMGLGALVMVDEPGLMAAREACAVVTLWDALRAVAPAWGLHVCGAVPWGLVDAAEPDVISYDLCRFGCAPAAQDVLRRLMRRGGRIMWGVVDPRAVEPASWAGARVAAAAHAVAGRRWRTSDVLDASLLSGTCGSGGLDVCTERTVAAVLGSVAAHLGGSERRSARARLGLDGGAFAAHRVHRPGHGEHPEAVADEAHAGDDGERRVSDVRTGHDHDPEDHEHERHADAPHAMPRYRKRPDQAHHAARNQPDAQQQRHGLDTAERVPDEQHARDHAQGPDDGHQATILGLLQHRGDQLENAVDQDEDPGDHGERGQAVTRLEQDDDAGHDAQHADDERQPPPPGERANFFWTEGHACQRDLHSARDPA